MNNLKSGSYDIALIDQLISLNGSMLSILKENGAPIIGCILLRPDPRYIFTQTEIHSNKSIHVTWSSDNDLQ